MRQNGMALGPIPLDKMYWYAERVLGIDDLEDQDAFVWVIRRVDGHFVNRRNAEAEQQAKQSK